MPGGISRGLQRAHQGHAAGLAAAQLKDAIIEAVPEQRTDALAEALVERRHLHVELPCVGAPLVSNQLWRRAHRCPEDAVVIDECAAPLQLLFSFAQCTTPDHLGASP